MGKMHAIDGQRAAAALDDVLPREDRAKTLARMLDCSVRMAKYLLAGDHWTARRIQQLSELLGDAFDAAMSANEPQATHDREMQIISARLEQLESDIEQMARWISAGMAPHPGTQSDGASARSEPAEIQKDGIEALRDEVIRLTDAAYRHERMAELHDRKDKRPGGRSL